MRVYHFINKEFRIEDLQKRRLKKATLNELNDPFELFGINLSDKALRKTFRKIKDELSYTDGLLCFSRGWRNPVQWSHYAEKHQGLCLGFDVPDGFLKQVSYSYSRKYLIKEIEQSLLNNQLDLETIRKFLLTKYAHWRYENEVRWIVKLGKKDPEKCKYFVDFSNDLKLAQVIVGAELTLTRIEICNALGDLMPHVETFKARLAFKTFRVVRQRKQKLWP